MTEDALALAAIEGIADGMLVGLGTGRAAARGIEALARRRLDITCVATSQRSEVLAASLGLRVMAMDGVVRVDYLFDGADEVDPALRMIKGRGGAMTREKIVARAAARRVYLVQGDKRVDRLGQTARLPIEVLRFGLASTVRALTELGLVATVRPGATSDDGNPILDAVLPELDIPALAAALDALPAVVGHGLFLDEADVVLVEDARGGVTTRVRS